MSISKSLALSALFPPTAGAAAFPFPLAAAAMKVDDDLWMVGLSLTAVVVVAEARWARELEADCKSSGWVGQCFTEL